MWLIKVFSAIYFTAVCAEDAGTYPTSPLPLSTAVNALAVPTLRLQTKWLDVFPSEKVEFSCSVAGSSDWTFTWFRSGKEVQDSDPNVSLSEEGSVLTITAAEMYSGSYTCKAHHKTMGVTTADSNPLILKVYPSNPKPTVKRGGNLGMMFPGEAVTFTCTVDVSSGWDFLWYHNGNELQAQKNTYTIVSIDHLNAGEYYCKAKRGKGPFYTEKSETTALQVSDMPKPSLRLLSSWSDVFENETVEFICEVDGSDWTFTWYKNKVQLQEDPVLYLEAEEPYLNITSITQAYQGGYACKVNFESRVTSEFSNTVNVTVYENIPRPTLSKDPSFNPMYVGETVNFTCNVNVSSGWEFKWYKDGKSLSETSKTISIYHSYDGGKYSCQATRSETTSTEISEEIPQDVLEIPVPSLKLITAWLDVFPDETVKMRCGMNHGSDWTYTWYKDGQLVQVDNVSFDKNGATLSINSASAAHAGEYKCKGHLNDRSVSSNSSSGCILTVYEKKPGVTLMQDPDFKMMFPGESVSFSCDINVSSGWEYLWFKDGKSLGEIGNRITISPVKTTNQGSYKCQAKRGNQTFITDTSQEIQLTVEKDKPKPSMTQHPDDDKVYTGESVSFKCKVELSTGWEYLWYKDGTRLPINSNSFNISGAHLSNSGTYKCMAIRSKTMYDTKHSDGRILRIFEIPVPSLRPQTSWLDVFPTEFVKMSCGMDGTTDWTYTWYKDGQKVQADNVSFDSDATTLSIESALASHGGQYKCSGKLKSRSVYSSLSSEQTLDVYDTIPRVTLMQKPDDNVLHTGDSVSFSCLINVSSGWEFLWYKDDILLVEFGNNYTITSVLMKNSGSYKCLAKRGRNKAFHSDHSQAVRLDIKERPKANIILLTGWSEVFSTDSLVLQCGVQESQDNWNYTWFKGNQRIGPPASEKYTVTPQNDTEQNLYSCQGIRTARPFYSKASDQFNTKNLLLKRRVLLSISGCIFFGIIAVFIGCIVLRVIRKPAEDEYKPEEADLFLSMKRKDCDDTPCPLVQYITDAALNTSSKDGDENGTICSETTPLPITLQDEEALMTESHDATETNSGLVSFKQ